MLKRDFQPGTTVLLVPIRRDADPLFTPTCPDWYAGKERRHRTAAWVLFLLIAGLIGFLLWTAPDSVPASQQWTGMAIISLGSLPLCFYLRDLRRSPFPFIPLVGLYYCAAYGLPIFNDYTARRVHLLDQVSTEATVLVLVGMSCLFLGFHVSRPYIGKMVGPYRLPRNYSLGNLKITLWCFLVCHLSYNYISALRSVPSFDQFQTYAGDIAYALFLFLWRRRLLSGAEMAILLGVAAPLEILTRLGSGLMAQVIFLAFLLLSVLWVSERTASWRVIGAGVILVIAFNLVKPEYRRLTWFLGPEAHASMARKVVLFSELAMDRLENYDTPAAGDQTITERLAMIGFMSHVVDETPEPIPYLYGQSYSGLLYSMIPRIAWPGKPVLNSGYWFSARYGMRAPGDEITSVNVPWLPEAYANFGIFGVTLGMFIIGVVLAVADRVFNSWGMTPLELLVGVCLLYGLTFQEASFTQMIAGIPPAALAFYLVFKLSLEKSGQNARATLSFRALKLGRP